MVFKMPCIDGSWLVSRCRWIYVQNTQETKGIQCIEGCPKLQGQSHTFSGKRKKGKHTHDLSPPPFTPFFFQRVYVLALKTMAPFHALDTSSPIFIQDINQPTPTNQLVFIYAWYFEDSMFKLISLIFDLVILLLPIQDTYLPMTINLLCSCHC